MTCDNQHVRLCLARQASQSATRFGPAYRPLLQDPNFQIDSLGLRSSSADLVIASATSKGLARPIQTAVPGINWAMPRAPAGLIAWASNRLSCQINRVRNSSGKSLSCAADCSVWHTESKVFVEAEDCARSGSAVAELFCFCLDVLHNARFESDCSLRTHIGNSNRWASQYVCVRLDESEKEC